MTQHKVIAAVAAILLIAALVASPYIAVRGMKQALITGDTDALQTYIDFPVLRQNMKDQINSHLAQDVAPELQDNPFAGFAALLATSMSDQLVDTLISPSMLANLMRSRQAQSAKDGTTPELLSNAQLSYDSLSRFRIALKGQDGDALNLYMYRHGLSWKLSRIDLPLDALNTPYGEPSIFSAD